MRKNRDQPERILDEALAAEGPAPEETPAQAPEPAEPSADRIANKMARPGWQSALGRRSVGSGNTGETPGPQADS